MAIRKRETKSVTVFHLSDFESDLIAQALDNYRDMGSSAPGFKTKLDVMVRLFNSNSEDGNYNFIDRVNGG